MKSPTKLELAEKLAELNSNCGKNDYFGYTMTDKAFINKIMKENLKSNIIELIYDNCEEGQKYIEQKGL